MLHLRLRQSTKKKKKINIKRPGAKKDEMKLGLLQLKSIVQREQTDGGPGGLQDSESDKGSLGQGGTES